MPVQINQAIPEKNRDAVARVLSSESSHRDARGDGDYSSLEREIEILEECRSRGKARWNQITLRLSEIAAEIKLSKGGLPRLRYEFLLAEQLKLREELNEKQGELRELKRKILALNADRQKQRDEDWNRAGFVELLRRLAEEQRTLRESVNDLIRVVRAKESSRG